MSEQRTSHRLNKPADKFGPATEYKVFVIDKEQGRAIVRYFEYWGGPEVSQEKEMSIDEAREHYRQLIGLGWTAPEKDDDDVDDGQIESQAKNQENKRPDRRSRSRTYSGFFSEQEAVDAMKKELLNWGWLSRDEKDEICENAKIDSGPSRFGDVFSITFQIR